MKNIRLGKLGNSDKPPINLYGKNSEIYRRYCMASWLLHSKTSKEIKEKWLKLWPYLSPYLRLIFISHKAKQQATEKPSSSFLGFWKKAIQLVGFDIVTATPEQVKLASINSQLPLKRFEELSELISQKNLPKHRLLALMTSVYNPEWGDQICKTFQLNIGYTKELNQEYLDVYFGLLITYKGF